MFSFIEELNFSSNKLSGIFSKIRSLGSVDIHSIVKTDQSSIYANRPASNLLDDTNSHFASYDANDSWILFVFLPRKLLLTSYSFKVAVSPDQHFPRKWSVNGSNDNISWFHIDSRETDIFSSYGQVETFECHVR